MRKRNLLLKVLLAATLTFGVVGLAGCNLSDLFHSHSWHAWEVDLAATCEAEGLKHRVCASCGEMEEMPIHPLGHEIEEYTYNEDATCQANGTKSGMCERETCAQLVTVEAANTRLPHTYAHVATSEFLKREATCTSKATYYLSCSVCKSVEDETFEYGEMKEHVYDREIVSETFFVSSELCEGDYYYKSCKCGATCGETFLDTQSVEHLWDNGKVTKNPGKDKKEDGEVCYGCENCGEENKKPLKADDDEDKDGLNNWEEIWDFECNPLAPDSDEDGLDDCEEVKSFDTNPNEADSDGDTLDDCKEVKDHHTNPNKPDTDEDGVKDGKELDNKTDPNEYNSSFDVDYEYKPADPEEEPDVVVPFIKVEGLGAEEAESITIERDDFFSKDMLGYMGKAYKFFMGNNGNKEHQIEVAFKFDKFDLTKHKQPWIYVFNELSKTLTPVEDTKVSPDAIISTEVDEFGTYILMDRYVYEDENSGLNAWIDYFEMGEAESTASAVQIVFVVDDSGSMDSNDPIDYSTYDYERLRVARDLIDELPQNSQIGIVKFCANINTLTPSLITSRTTAKDYLQSTQNGGYFTNNGGSTYMYQAIWEAFNLFEDGEDVTKIMIILSDGEAHDDYYSCSYNGISGTYRDLVPQKAVDEGVKLYTVGLGNAASYAFEEQLKPLSAATNGQFYYSADASQLSNIYGDIQIKIDLTTDSDKDGLIDYYEKNPVDFSGIQYSCDPTVKDTDGDGLEDGEEVVVLKILSITWDDNMNVTIGEKMLIIGRVFSDPANSDTDNDGINDKKDDYPMDSSRS